MAAGGKDLEFKRALLEIVVALVADETDEVALRGGLLRGGDVPPGEIARAGVDDLALRDERFHGHPDFVEGAGAVDVMHLEKINVVGLEALEASLAAGDDLARGQAAGEIRIGLAGEIHFAVNLGREDDFFAPSATLGKPAADDFFGDALALLPAVDVGGVEEIDADFERLVHDGEAVGLGRLRTEVHGAETKIGNSETAATEVYVFHGDWG